MYLVVNQDTHTHMLALLHTRKEKF